MWGIFTLAHQFKVSKSINYKACEALISKSTGMSDDIASSVLMATRYNRDFFLETWASMAIATALGRENAGEVALWGMSSADQVVTDRAATVPPGLVAAFLSAKVVAEGDGSVVSYDNVREWIEKKLGGSIADGPKGSERLLVEFDDARARTLTDLQLNDNSIDERTFSALIREYRTDLEFWRVRDIDDNFREETLSTDRSNSVIEELSRFFHEIFENAYKHGRFGKEGHGKNSAHLRYLRVRKVVGQREGLKKRAQSSFPGVFEFVSRSVDAGKTPAFIELTISDFGRGILDQFLETGAGARFAQADRRALLDALLFKELTSTPLDTQAGKGISRALKAAKALGAFVSLRTAEFHYAAAFDQSQPISDFKPIELAEPRGPVRGTHWQFLWAPPY